MSGHNGFFSELQPITDPDEIAVLEEHLDPAVLDAVAERDRAHFEQHPDEESYQRALVPGEFPPPKLPPPPPGFHWEPMVEVVSIGPGLRARKLAWAALVADGEQA